jgi:hypothetical protein
MHYKLLLENVVMNILLASPSPQNIRGHGDKPGLHTPPPPLTMAGHGWIDEWAARAQPNFVIPGHVLAVSTRPHSFPCAQWRRFVIILDSISAGGRRLLGAWQ